MRTRDHDDDPLLDVRDVLWWCGFSGLSLGVLLLGNALHLPWWALLLVAFLVGLAARPLYRRYDRQLEAKRPSNNR